MTTQSLTDVEKILVAEYPHHRLYHLPSYRAMMMEPRGHLPEAEFQTVHMELLRLCLVHKVRVVIVNETELERVYTRSRIWLVSNFLRLPQVRSVQRQIDHMVIIRPKSALAAMLTRAMHRIATGITGMPLEYFASEEEAYTALWP